MCVCDDWTKREHELQKDSKKGILIYNSPPKPKPHGLAIRKTRIGFCRHGHENQWGINPYRHHKTWQNKWMISPANEKKKSSISLSLIIVNVCLWDLKEIRNSPFEKKPRLFVLSLSLSSHGTNSAQKPHRPHSTHTHTLHNANKVIEGNSFPPQSNRRRAFQSRPNPWPLCRSHHNL